MNEQTVRKTYRYKLQPTAEQEGAMEFVLRRCRELYNAGLQERRDAWQKRGMSVTAACQSTQLPAVKEVRPEYHDVHSQVLQDVLTRLERAFQAFFRRVKAGETPGYPRFHCAHRYNSFTYKQFGNGAMLDNGLLVLSKIGRIAVRCSRPIEGAPKTVTLSREADGWYVCFSCEGVPIRPLPITGQETGIDLELESFATLADGSQIANPRILRLAEWHLKRAQRRVSRRKKGSHRRREAVKLQARAHQQVRRARRDLHHKAALILVHQYDTTYHEDLQTAHLLRNHHLAKSIADAGWNAFLSILSFKAVCVGRRVVAVPPAYTSQTCSGCGVIVHKGLSVRWHLCPDCGTSLHRDHNAAKNIERAGQALRGAVASAAAENRASPAFMRGSVKIPVRPTWPADATSVRMGTLAFPKAWHAPLQEARAKTCPEVLPFEWNEKLLADSWAWVQLQFARHKRSAGVVRVWALTHGVPEIIEASAIKQLDALLAA